MKNKIQKIIFVLLALTALFSAPNVFADFIPNYNYNYSNCYIYYFSASPASINYGSSTTLSWNTNGCSSVSISNIGNVPAYGNQIVYPFSTTNYTLTAYSYYGGINSRSAQVYVNNNYYNPPPVTNNCAITTAATNITQNSATLNWIITNVNVYNPSAYFEYSLDVDLSYQTTHRSVGNGSFSEILTGLSPNTIYFYRLISNCGGGTSRGTIQVFQTAGNPISNSSSSSVSTTTKTIVQRETTFIGKESPTMLKSNLAGWASFGWFFNLGIIGWLLLLILVLLIILLACRYFSDRNRKN